MTVAVTAAPIEVTAPAPRRTPLWQGTPETHSELDLDDLRGISGDAMTPEHRDAWPEPTPRELEILVALHRHRVLFSTQIWRRW
jgi:hypothetical protein